MAAVTHLFAMVAAGFAVGYFLDHRLTSSPWFTLLFAFVGLGLGFYRLYKSVQSNDERD